MANAWELTWEEILEIGQTRKRAVIDRCGRLICSQDRPLDVRLGRTMYLDALKATHLAGKPIPERVKASEPQIFGVKEIAPPEPPAGPYAGMKPMKLPEDPPAPPQPRFDAPLSLFD